MSALDEYLEQFYNNPLCIEEFKINFLKNHYFDIVSKYLMIERNDLLIGVGKNRNLIYFKCKDSKSIPVILNRSTNKFIHFD